jgi:hypothetical protein
VPPPALSPLAALALAGQPFGFTPADVQVVRAAAERSEDQRVATALRNLGERIESLLPPDGPS